MQVLVDFFCVSKISHKICLHLLKYTNLLWGIFNPGYQAAFPHCLCDDLFNRFDRTSVCDRQTDRQTDGRRDRDRTTEYTALYRASI